MAKDSKNLGINLIQRMAGQANTLTIPRLFIDITTRKRQDGKMQRDYGRALFLSQCCYWEGIKKGGSFYKSDSEWCDELGMVRSVLVHVRNALAEMGLINVSATGPRGCNVYSVNWENLEAAVNAVLSESNVSESRTGEELTSDSNSPKVGQVDVRGSDSGESESRTGDCPNVGQPIYTENTLENTQEREESENALSPPVENKKNQKNGSKKMDFSVQDQCGPKCKPPEYWVQWWEEKRAKHVGGKSSATDKDLTRVRSLHDQHADGDVPNSGCRKIFEMAEYYWQQYDFFKAKKPIAVDKFCFAHQTLAFFCTDAVQNALEAGRNKPADGDAPCEIRWEKAGVEYAVSCAVCGGKKFLWKKMEAKGKGFACTKSMRMCPDCDGDPINGRKPVKAVGGKV